MTAEMKWCDTMSVPELLDTFKRAMRAADNGSYVEMCAALHLTSELVDGADSLQELQQIIAVRVSDLCNKYVEVTK